MKCEALLVAPLTSIELSFFSEWSLFQLQLNFLRWMLNLVELPKYMYLAMLEKREGSTSYLSLYFHIPLMCHINQIKPNRL